MAQSDLPDLILDDLLDLILEMWPSPPLFAWRITLRGVELLVVEESLHPPLARVGITIRLPAKRRSKKKTIRTEVRIMNWRATNAVAVQTLDKDAALLALRSLARDLHTLRCPQTDTLLTPAGVQQRPDAPASSLQEHLFSDFIGTTFNAVGTPQFDRHVVPTDTTYPWMHELEVRDQFRTDDRTCNVLRVVSPQLVAEAIQWASGTYTLCVPSTTQVTVQECASILALHDRVVDALTGDRHG